MVPVHHRGTAQKMPLVGECERDWMLAATHSHGAAVRFAVLVCSHCIVLRQGVVPTA